MPEPDVQLSLKHMVCARCRQVVKQTMESLGYEVTQIELGYVKAVAPANADPDVLMSSLRSAGFEPVLDPEEALVEGVKREIRELIQRQGINSLKSNLSDYLAERLNRDYSSISHIFSAHEQLTIERYFILQRIEKAKEWISYRELTMAEIAGRLGYSSAAYLTNQFKMVTGMTPTEYKKLAIPPRMELDRVGSVPESYNPGT